MADIFSFEGVPVLRNANPFSRRVRDDQPAGIVRLLDSLPWWAVVVLASLTYVSLHQLANADIAPVPHAGTMEAMASRAIIQILAGAGQYLFPLILLGEAVGAAIASRRLGARNAGKAGNTARLVMLGAPAKPGTVGSGEEAPSAGTRENLPPARPVWSLALLSRMDLRRYVVLTRHYYREKGIHCQTMPPDAAVGIGLKLFQDNSGKASTIVQFRPWGAPWVGAKQIRALRTVMDGERIVKGFFMTPGAFSRDAKECAREYGITLIDAKLFLMMIRRLPAAAQERLLAYATKDE